MQSKYIDINEYFAIYKYMQRENVLALQVALNTGLRINDVLKLRRSDFQGNTFTYIAEKTGKKGKKTLPSNLYKQLLSIAGENYIFPGRNSSSKHRTRQAVWRDMKKACKALGIDASGVSCHSARKTYSVNVLKEFGFTRAQRELQHSRADQTMLYVFSDILNTSEHNSTIFRNDDAIDVIAQKIWEKLRFWLENREKERKT